jgi:hypothetical protein
LLAAKRLNPHDEIRIQIYSVHFFNLVNFGIKLCLF